MKKILLVVFLMMILVSPIFAQDEVSTVEAVGMISGVTILVIFGILFSLLFNPVFWLIVIAIMIGRKQ